MKKGRIEVHAVSHTPHEVMAAQAALTIARGIPFVLPLVTDTVDASRALAIVGGGHPIDLPALKSFTGDIWAVNGMHDWLLDREIETTLFMADPHPCMAEYATRATRAVLASCCHSSVFDALEGKRVHMFHMGGMAENPLFKAKGLEHERFNPLGVNTAASRIHMLGIWMGYTSQHYFGCSGSYVDPGMVTPSNSHVYAKAPEHSHDQELIIKAGPDYYRTNLALMQQSEFFAEIFAAVPSYFHERSGGLVRAMMMYPDWEVTHVSEVVRQLIGMAPHQEAA